MVLGILTGLALSPNGMGLLAPDTAFALGDWIRLPGVVFLSGGQGDEEATAHLSAMNSRHPNLPWPLTFSYSRALHQSVMEIWKGSSANVAAAQKQQHRRARLNSLASTGSYQPQMEREAA